MSGNKSIGELDARYSSADATPTSWAETTGGLEQAEIYWLTTVRPDGRPHVTPLLSIWMEDALYFCTGQTERKARNLASNAHCVLTTGCNAFSEDGLDLVVEGDAIRVTDDTKLHRIADAYEAKYGSDWHFDVEDSAFNGQEGNIAIVFEVRPTTVFAFGKGSTFSQTRWRF